MLLESFGFFGVSIARVAGEGEQAGHQEVGGDAEGPDVGSLVDFKLLITLINIELLG